MQIGRITIRRITPEQAETSKGLIGFCSVILDGWLYLGDISIFSRADGSGIRLIFPGKKLGNGKLINIFYPIKSEHYFELEKAVSKECSLLLKQEKI